MPRVSDIAYLERRRKLQSEWIGHGGGSFAGISVDGQWRLHDYFMPDQNLTNEELLAHRRKICRARPNLSRQAGHDYRQFETEFERLQLVRSIPRVMLKKVSLKDRKIVVRAIAQPQPDVHKLARALVAIAKSEAGQ